MAFRACFVNRFNLQGVLFNIKNQSFQVFALGMIDVDGMVGGLMKLMEYAHTSSTLSGSCEDSHAELVLRHRLRTREGEKNATMTYLLKRLKV